MQLVVSFHAKFTATADFRNKFSCFGLFHEVYSLWIINQMVTTNFYILFKFSASRTDAWGMAIRHLIVIESRNAVKTYFCLHNLWKDLGTHKLLAISGRVPGTRCWNLTGSQEPVEPVLVRSLNGMVLVLISLFK